MSLPQELVNWALAQGFDADNINSRIENGTSPLMLAAQQNDLSRLQLLLDAGADVNLINDDENNALWFACFANNPHMAQLLIDYDCDINNQNVNGATALVYCASAGKYELVRRLVEAGADVHRKTLDGFTALDSASTLPILKFLKPLYAESLAC